MYLIRAAFASRRYCEAQIARRTRSWRMASGSFSKPQVVRPWGAVSLAFGAVLSTALACSPGGSGKTSGPPIVMDNAGPGMTMDPGPAQSDLVVVTAMATPSPVTDNSTSSGQDLLAGSN